MDILKKSRTIARSHFTKAKNVFQTKMETTPFQADEVKIAYEYLSEKAEKLFSLDESIYEKLIASDMSAEDIEVEETTTENYRLDWLRLKSKYDTHLLFTKSHVESSSLPRRSESKRKSVFTV
ncbi:hypothetical protein ACJJTC_000697 [Scirpophaga incertulas]